MSQDRQSQMDKVDPAFARALHEAELVYDDLVPFEQQAKAAEPRPRTGKIPLPLDHDLALIGAGYRRSKGGRNA